MVSLSEPMVVCIVLGTLVFVTAALRILGAEAEHHRRVDEVHRKAAALRREYLRVMQGLRDTSTECIDGDAEEASDVIIEDEVLLEQRAAA